MEVTFIDSMGDDLRVANAARVSFNKESEYDWYDEKGNFKENGVISEKDKKLIKYLATHGHWTPFSHCTVTLREKVPIFVARQRFKHFVGFTYNEVSRRYVDDTPEFFVPDVWRSRPEGSVKQGSGVGEIKHIVYKEFYAEYGHGTQLIDIEIDIKDEYRELLNYCENIYNKMIQSGVAPEQARMVLPQSLYTEYYVTGSLYAFARAYKLRADSHAQKEIQDVAIKWDEIIRTLFPVSWSALVD